MAKLALICLFNTPNQEEGLAETAVQVLREGGHEVFRENLRADYARVKGLLVAALSDPRFDGLILVGDLPPGEQEAIASVVEKISERKLPGFDQTARHLLLPQEGANLVLSWFSAGSTSSRLLMAIPGPAERVKTLLEGLVLPQLTRLLEWARF